MKKIFYSIIAAAAFVTMPAMAQESTNFTATFENVEGVTLTTDGYYIGKETENTFDSYGATGYYSNYKQGPFTFSNSYTPSFSAWTGFGISNRTQTTYKNLNPDQYNNVVGGGYGGSANFCVIFDSQDSIMVDESVTQLKGFYITNSAYTANSFLNGDGCSNKFTKNGDFIKVTLTGKKADNSIVKKEIMLAEFSDGTLKYISDWQWVDLSDFTGVKTISFGFDGSDKSKWGLNTPKYCVIDNLSAMVSTGIENTFKKETEVYEVARYSVNGARLNAPQRGLNIVKMSDGTTRKVMVK